MFLYGGDAQAGRPASLTYGAVARIAAQELEYEGDAAGEADGWLEPMRFYGNPE